MSLCKLKCTLKVVLILAFRNRKGKGATGILIQIAESKGYNNVADYLKALQTKKGTDEFDEEEDEEVVEGDDEGAGRLVSVNKWEFASQIGTVRLFRSYNYTNFAKIIDMILHIFRSRATLTVMVCPAY